jgi:anti-anti-sigma factor
LWFYLYNIHHLHQRTRAKIIQEAKLDITVTKEQGRVPVTVFHIEGDLGAETFDQLESQAQQAIQSGMRFLVLDLSNVPYVSSYGIRGISQIYKWLQNPANGEEHAAQPAGVVAGPYKSHHLKLASPSQQVLRALTNSGIDMFIEIHTDVKQAVASF